MERKDIGFLNIFHTMTYYWSYRQLILYYGSHAWVQKVAAVDSCCPALHMCPLHVFHWPRLIPSFFGSSLLYYVPFSPWSLPKAFLPRFFSSILIWWKIFFLISLAMFIFFYYLHFFSFCCLSWYLLRHSPVLCHSMLTFYTGLGNSRSQGSKSSSSDLRWLGYIVRTKE